MAIENAKAQIYWNEFWNGNPPTDAVDAWQFGFDADGLAKLVIDGVKTATCGAYVFYEIENAALPKSGSYSIVLNQKDEPVAIIRLVSVEVLPMNEVPEDFAWAEGEGDRSYRFWWDAHEAFFTEALAEIGREFSPEMLVVCERFELVDVKGV